MKRTWGIIAALFVCTVARGMEVEEQLDVSLLRVLPVELFFSLKHYSIENSQTVYKVQPSNCIVPYALRTIDPVKFFEGSTHGVDLTPNLEDPIILEPQFWKMGVNWTLFVERVQTGNRFLNNYNMGAMRISITDTFFEGINHNRLALVGETNDERFRCYALYQAADGQTESYNSRTIFRYTRVFKFSSITSRNE